MNKQICSSLENIRKYPKWIKQMNENNYNNQIAEDTITQIQSSGTSKKSF